MHMSLASSARKDSSIVPGKLHARPINTAAHVLSPFTAWQRLQQGWDTCVVYPRRCIFLRRLSAGIQIRNGRCQALCEE